MEGVRTAPILVKLQPRQNNACKFEFLRANLILEHLHIGWTTTIELFQLWGIPLTHRASQTQYSEHSPWTYLKHLNLARIAVKATKDQLLDFQPTRGDLCKTKHIWAPNLGQLAFTAPLAWRTTTHLKDHILMLLFWLSRIQICMHYSAGVEA